MSISHTRPAGDGSPWTVAHRTPEPGDLTALLALNNAAIPHVNRLTRDELAELLGSACMARVALVGGRPAAFVLVLGPGLAYGSPNYRWFAREYDEFLYVDRVVVDALYRRAGVGDALYRAVMEEARRRGCAVTCEVNVEPPNAASLRFHERHGFVEVGRQRIAEDKVVALLARSSRAVESDDRAGRGGHEPASTADATDGEDRP